MAASSYDEALRRLLVHEGGYSNHPADPGGPTNFGITLADYRKYVKPNATAADVRAMKLAEAKAIYGTKYWSAMRCDELPAGVDYAVFDYGVNSGIGRAGKVLRRQLGLADDTSVITDGVIAAAKRAHCGQLVAAICDERLRFLRGLRTWPVFGAGWGRRVAEVKAAALTMAAASKPATDSRRTTQEAAASSSVPSSAVPPPSSGKGVAPARTGAQKLAAGGVIAAGGVAAGQAHHGGSSIAAVLIIMGLAVAAWALWHWRHKRRQQAPA